MSQDFSLTSTAGSEWNPSNTAPAVTSPQDNVPHFVRSYLALRRPASQLGLKKGHFVPDVLKPKEPALPNAGAAVSASNREFLRRQRASKETYIVSADLIGMSTKKNQHSKRGRRQKHKQIAPNIARTPWKNRRFLVVRYLMLGGNFCLIEMICVEVSRFVILILYPKCREFIKWQNKILKNELDKHQFDPLADPEEREIVNATVLKIRGSRVQVGKITE